MPSLGFALAAYYVLATSEASTNLARYKGMLFGVRGGQLDQSFNDYFSEVRSANFGKEAKRRVLLGTYTRMVGFRNRYYLKALAVRQLIIKEYQGLMERDDLIITPTMPFIAPRFTEIAKMKPLEVYQADFLTVPPNLTGMPHISLPCGSWSPPTGKRGGCWTPQRDGATTSRSGSRRWADEDRPRGPRPAPH
jgi:aspartyl-tRNA(Asn)/glutamyl-tRNA(Gln) amidotransferase subunit A